MRTLNPGTLEHVDARKTSIGKRRHNAAGVIDTIGSVDEGSTHTDTLALERQRRITIKYAVVSFVIDDVTVNLISSPHRSHAAQSEGVSAARHAAGLVKDPS